MEDENARELSAAERAFVLRLWPAGKGRDRGQWRIVLQDVDSERRRGFAHLDEFFAYMEALWAERRG